MSLTIQQLQRESWETSEQHGFHDSAENLSIPTKLMLIVSELAEALEEYRVNKPLRYYTEDGKPEGIAAELADVAIRLGDLAEILGIDLEAAIIEKAAYNKTRPYKHGGKKI